MIIQVQQNNFFARPWGWSFRRSSSRGCDPTAPAATCANTHSLLQVGSHNSWPPFLNICSINLLCLFCCKFFWWSACFRFQAGNVSAPPTPALCSNPWSCSMTDTLPNRQVTAASLQGSAWFLWPRNNWLWCMVVIILALDNAYSIDSVKSIGSDKYIEPTLSRCEAHDPVHGSFINLMKLPNARTLICLVPSSNHFLFWCRSCDERMPFMMDNDYKT